MNAEGFSEIELESYRTEGYIVAECLFNEDDLARTDETIRSITREALKSQDYSKVMELEPELLEGEPVARRIYNPFEQHEDFRALATDPRMLAKVGALIGPNFGIQHSKLNMKPAKVGSVVDWHQDLTYFPHTNDDLVTVLVYLDDATEENGCLQVLPRQHHHFLNHMGPDGQFAGLITEDIDPNRFGKPVSLAAKAGSAIFMHCLTPHSSLPNTSDKGRRTLIFEYRAADSFPIFFGGMSFVNESLAHHISGQQAQFARFGGPAPFIPRVVEATTSLYDLQAKTKAKTAA